MKYLKPTNNSFNTTGHPSTSSQYTGGDRTKLNLNLGGVQH